MISINTSLKTHTANPFKAYPTPTQYRCFLWFQWGAFLTQLPILSQPWMCCLFTISDISQLSRVKIGHSDQMIHNDLISVKELNPITVYLMSTR